MKTQMLDGVEIYETLKHKFSESDSRAHLGMFFFFLGRLGKFNQDAGAMTRTEVMRIVTIGWALLEDANIFSATQMAASTEENALTVSQDAENGLAKSAFWASASFYFQFLIRPDTNFINFTLDTYLNFVEELYLDRADEGLQNELENVKLSIDVVSELMNRNAKAIGVRAIVDWAFTAPIGTALTPP